MRAGPVFRALGAIAALAGTSPLADLNAVRAANGIPAGIVENPAWSAGCALHMAYLERNAFGGDWHTEVPGRPGYTDAGREAAASAVLSNAPSLGLVPDWQSSPLHYAQLLAPALLVSGATPGCIFTWPGYQRPAPPALTVYPFPGDGVQDATSPYLYVLAAGGGTGEGTVTGATLEGPSGPVGLTVLDNHAPGTAGYLPPGAILAPRTPLQDHSLYVAQATFTSDLGPAATRRWSFRTGEVGATGETPAVQGTGSPEPMAANPLPSARTPRVTLSLRPTRTGTRVLVRARGAAVGRRVRVRVRRLDCRCWPTTRTVRLARTARVIDSKGARIRVTVVLRAFFAGEIPYRGLTLVRTLS